MDRVEFAKEVIQASHQQPVVVDFWASWCGPCRMLKPILEKVNSEQSDRWKLVKIDTETAPEVAEEAGVRGIPDVRMYYGGEEIARFSGAIPEPQFREWIDTYVPDECKKKLQRLKKAISQQCSSALLEELAGFVQSNPDLEEAKILLAQCTLYSDPQKAKQLVSSIKRSSKLYSQVESINALAELLSYQQSGEGKAFALFKQYQQAVQEQNLEKAIEYLIAAISLNNKVANGVARNSGIALFKQLGEDHPLSKQYLRKFRLAAY